MTESTAVAAAPARREMPQVLNPVPIFDTSRFEHMNRIAVLMARASLCPQALTHVKPEGADKPIALEFEVVVANCFLVVNQADRWNADPFAVAQCVSIVRGKLCFEGKLVQGVIEARLGVDFDYLFGKHVFKDGVHSVDLTEKGGGDDLGVIVRGTYPDGKVREVFGWVGAWKTTHSGSPWANSANHERQLRYRGAREWGRAHEPGLLLGVYTDDEMEDLREDYRAARATPVPTALRQRAAERIGHQQPAPGANGDHIRSEIGVKAPLPAHDPETGEILEDKKPAEVKPAPAAATAAPAETKPRAAAAEPAKPAEAKVEPEKAATAPTAEKDPAPAEAEKPKPAQRKRTEKSASDAGAAASPSAPVEPKAATASTPSISTGGERASPDDEREEDDVRATASYEDTSQDQPNGQNPAESSQDEEPGEAELAAAEEAGASWAKRSRARRGIPAEYRAENQPDGVNELGRRWYAGFDAEKAKMQAAAPAL